MSREIMDLKDQVITLENKRVKLTKEKLMEFKSGEEVDFDEIRKTMNAEREKLALLRLNLQDHREHLTTSKDELESKIMQACTQKDCETVKRCLNTAHDNLLRHNGCLQKFVDRMMKGLEIAEGNLRKLMSKNLDLTEDTTPLFEEARKYLEEGTACMNYVFQAIETMFSALEKTHVDTVKRALLE